MCTYNLEYNLKRIVKFMYSNVYACVCKFVCVCSLWHLTLFYSDSKQFLSKFQQHFWKTQIKPEMKIKHYNCRNIQDKKRVLKFVWNHKKSQTAKAIPEKEEQS